MVTIYTQRADEKDICDIYVVGCLGVVEQAHSPKDGGPRWVSQEYEQGSNVYQ